MTRTKYPANQRPAEHCGGRLTAKPLVRVLDMPDGSRHRWFYGRRWLLDGKEIHPLDAYVFQCLWENAARKGEPAADWTPPDW